MKLKPEFIIEVMKSDLRTLYNMFRLTIIEEGEEIEENEDYKQVRGGVKVKFDIHRIINKLYVERPKQGVIIIGDEQLTLEEYWDEMEKRETIIRKKLYDNIEEGMYEGRALTEMVPRG